MKQAILILLIVLSKMTCFGQSMFFDNLDHTIWKSKANYNELIIRMTKNIELTKLNNSKDSLKVNATIWAFKDEILNIVYYDYKLGKDGLLFTCKYGVESDKGILKLILNNTKTLTYSVGIISTGNYILLTRKKK